MAACDGEDNSGSEAVGLGCALELFKEHEEITQIIKQLPSVYRERSTLDITYERFVYILSQYQEQPHLLDPYLDTLLENLLNIGRDPNFHDGLRHKAFQFLYIITKVRNYKVVVRHLPHEVADVEPVLSLLAEQNPFDHETWETRYILLLWLSIIVMIPFHMERLDSNNKFNEGQKKPTMERIIDVIKLYLSVGDKVQDAAAFLASRFITRPDVKEVHLFSFLEWSLQILESDVSSMNGLNLQAGVLAALALLFKHGKREDVKGYGIEILKKVLGCGLMDSKSTVVRKMVLKLIQRIGNSPQVPNIPHRNDLVQVFSQDVCHKVNWAAPAETFPLFMMLLCLKTYTYSLLRGVCVSVGGLTESLVKYSRASLLFYLNSVQNDMDTFNYICETLLKVFKNNLGKDYVTIPFLKTVDHLLAAGVFTIFSSLVNHSFPLELLDLCWKEVAKSKDPQKIMAAIDVFCGLLQFPEVCGKRALTILAIHLCHRYPRIRKVTADKIYEALISYPEITSEDAADDVMTILSDTEWDVNVEVLRPIRNKLCELLGIPAPKSVK